MPAEYLQSSNAVKEVKFQKFRKFHATIQFSLKHFRRNNFSGWFISIASWRCTSPFWTIFEHHLWWWIYSHPLHCTVNNAESFGIISLNWISSDSRKITQESSWQSRKINFPIVHVCSPVISLAMLKYDASISLPVKHVFDADSEFGKMIVKYGVFYTGDGSCEWMYSDVSLSFYFGHCTFTLADPYRPMYWSNTISNNAG